MTQVSPETAQRSVEAAYDAMTRRDLDAWLDCLTADFFLAEPPELPDAGVFRGHEGARQWAEMTLASMKEWRWTPEEFLENDGRTLVVRLTLSGESTAGFPIEMSVFHVFEMSGDRLASVRSFLDESAARSAAALPSGS